MREPLKCCTVRESVMFTGAADKTLFSANGNRLEFDPELRLIFAKAARADRDEFAIPLENILNFTFISEAETARRDKVTKDALAAKAAAAQAAADAKKPKPKALLGVSKMVKNPVTGEIEEIKA